MYTQWESVCRENPNLDAVAMCAESKINLFAEKKMLIFFLCPAPSTTSTTVWWWPPDRCVTARCLRCAWTRWWTSGRAPSRSVSHSTRRRAWTSPPPWPTFAPAPGWWRAMAWCTTGPPSSMSTATTWTGWRWVSLCNRGWFHPWRFELEVFSVIYPVGTLTNNLDRLKVG